MNPLWILALLAIGKKKNKSNPTSTNPSKSGNPVVQDDYLDRL